MHSNSSLNCFTDCMAKYEQQYILRNPCEITSPHLTFGSMAHEVLYNAGSLRDALFDSLSCEYQSVIPSELQYSELKEFFKIPNWYNYFHPVITAVEQYEQQFVDKLCRHGPVTVDRELKLQVTPETLAYLGFDNIFEPLVGIVDVLIRTKDYAVILDYKFSTKIKTQDDFDMNSQLQLYAFLTHISYDIPLRNIIVGYIDIPKHNFDEPDILKNGTLSRSKTQSCTAEAYKQAVIDQHGDDSYYNCEKGGYYYDVYLALSSNKYAYLTYRNIDIQIYNEILGSLMDTTRLIDIMKRQHLPFVKQHNSYSCSSCGYKKSCKPYLEV